MLRRFGLLAWLATWCLNAIDMDEVVPASWYSGRVLVAIAIPSIVGAWALWVILSAQGQPATESAARA